jgi:hypothetical protein
LCLVDIPDARLAKSHKHRSVENYHNEKRHNVQKYVDTDIICALEFIVWPLLKASVIPCAKAKVLHDEKEGQRNNPSEQPACDYQCTGSNSRCKTKGDGGSGCTKTLYGDHHEKQHGNVVKRAVAEKVYLTKCCPEMPNVVFRQQVNMKRR